MQPHHGVMRSRLLAGLALVLSALGAASPAAAGTKIDWPTFGLNFQRNNYNPSETVLATGSVGGMQQLWRAALGTDNKYQPSLIRAVATQSGTVDLVIVTLPGGMVAALNAATGQTVWQTRFALAPISCAGSTASLGIGEPVTIDVAKSRGFVVDGGGSKFFGMVSFDPATNAVYVSNPLDSADGTYRHGLIALQANAACQLSLLWQQTVGPNGNSSPSVTPVIANGVVYYAEGSGNQLAAFDAANGAQLWISQPLAGPLNAPPIVVNGVVYVGAGKFMYAFGLPP